MMPDHTISTEEGFSQEGEQENSTAVNHDASSANSGISIIISFQVW